MKTINKKHGYAILLTLVVVSIITSITIGVSNSVHKQMILSSLASDSQIAFYTADTAAECALYLSETPIPGLSGVLSSTPPTFDCGLDANGDPFSMNLVQDPDPALIKYYLDTPSSLTTCFKVSIDKTTPLMTTVESRGYNTCDTSTNRQVERGIKVEY